MSMNGYNDFTRECDKHLRHKSEYYKTYLWDMGKIESDDERKNGIVCFRTPGATRGHIELDENNMITDIVFYPETCFTDPSKTAAQNSCACYHKSVLSVRDKFIGTIYDKSKVESKYE